MIEEKEITLHNKDDTEKEELPFKMDEDYEEEENKNAAESNKNKYEISGRKKSRKENGSSTSSPNGKSSSYFCWTILSQVRSPLMSYKRPPSQQAYSAPEPSRKVQIKIN